MAAGGPIETAYRQPTELLALSGAFEKDPRRRRPLGPKSDRPNGEPPACLVPDEAACWRGFVANASAGVLTSGDRWALERLWCLMAESPHEGLNGAETGHLRALLGEIGGIARLPLPCANPWGVAPPGWA